MLTRSTDRRIGYIGVDVLNNATVCNEAVGLLREKLPLEIVSVYPYESATFYQDRSLTELREAVANIFPIRRRALAWALVAGPLVFGRRYWATWLKAVQEPAEGLRQRLTVLYQVLPALILAMRWKDRGIGHIHAHWAHTATSVAMHTAELLGVGFSFTGHANDLFVHRVGLAAKVRRARFIVCISEFHRQFYLAMGADPDRLKVIYCGIDTSRFHDALGESRLKLTAGIPRIVAVGRLVEKKGFHDLITACERLRDEGLDFECVIAGSGPESERLAEMIASARLTETVRMTNQTVLQEDLPGLLRSAQMTVLPCVRDRDGDMDGLPQVLIESLLCGVPVISTRLVGIPDIVRHEETGLLVAPGDPSALASAMRRMLESREFSEELGNRGRAWALEHFSRDETVRRLRLLFEACLDDPTDRPPALEMPAARASGDSVVTPSSRAFRRHDPSIAPQLIKTQIHPTTRSRIPTDD